MAANTITNLPKDPMILLSVINTKIRDIYHTLDALCEDMQIEKAELIEVLKGIDYEYDHVVPRSWHWGVYGRSRGVHPVR